MNQLVQRLMQEHNDAMRLAMSIKERIGLNPGEAALDDYNRHVLEANRIRVRLEQAKTEAAQVAEIQRLTGGLVDAPGGGSPGGGSMIFGNGRTYGTQFVNCDVMRWLKDSKNSRGGTWNSPAAELTMPEMMATTLDESGGSGGNLVVPHYLPGILPMPTRRLVMADLIAPGTTDSNLVTYMKETAFTNAAATTAEGAAKPESALTFIAVSDPVRKIAHWVPVTEEMLEDVPAIRAYLDTRLGLGVQLAEDYQLLNGSVVAPDVVGFLNRTGLAASIARVAEVNADTVLSQMMAIWIATNLQPDGIVMNPSNWKTCLLQKDANGQYYGGGPFASPHAPTLWGLPVALTTAIATGTALVGCFKTAAQLFRKGGLRVEASNSHNDYFTKNLVAIRAEERLALAVYRPSAFGTVTNLV